MKTSHKIALLIPLINTGITHTFPFRQFATIASAAIAAYPLFYNTYIWSQNRNNRDALIPTLHDVDSSVESHVRNQLRTHGYDNADTLPIKICDGFPTLLALLDGCLAFSTTYETTVKEALSSDSDDVEAQRILGDLNTDLNHELFHIQDQHALQSIRAQACIPIIAELALLPLTIKLLGIKNIAAFSTGIIGSISVRQCTYKLLCIIHRKSQEQAADNWAFQKNNNPNDLTACMENRTSIVRRGFADLYHEHAIKGFSQSKLFNILIRLLKIDIPTIDEQRLDNDQKYAQEYLEEMQRTCETWEQKPGQWPLRLLQYAFDPEHPFVLDSAKQIQKRIEEL